MTIIRPKTTRRYDEVKHLEKGSLSWITQADFGSVSQEGSQRFCYKRRRIVINEVRHHPARFGDGSRLQESRDANRAVLEPGRDKEADDLLMLQEQTWLS